MKKKPYVYGQSPNPNNWKEAAEVLAENKPKVKKDKSELMTRLDEIEKMLKERK